MTKDYTKTDRVLLLIQAICKAPRLTLSEAKVKDILGNPSKAQYHKLVNELIEDVGDRKAILIKKKDEEGNISFQLNECNWVNYLEGTSEIHFILKSYREMGHLFPKIDVEGVAVHAKNIDRRFHYLCKVKAKESDSLQSSHLEKIIKALVGNRRLFINYQDKAKVEVKTVEIFPLTLVQYRDDLYLVAYKSEMSDENLRHYKVSRIKNIVESRSTFRYPVSSKWDPKEYFKNISGIFVGAEKKAVIRVFNESRVILSEKSFYGSTLVNQTKDYDDYECIYTNIEEFLGYIFIYGQDIEVISDKYLRVQMRKKAEKILERINE